MTPEMNEFLFLSNIISKKELRPLVFQVVITHLKIFAQNSGQNSGLAQNCLNLVRNVRITQTYTWAEEYEGGF